MRRSLSQGLSGWDGGAAWEATGLSTEVPESFIVDPFPPFCSLLPLEGAGASWGPVPSPRNQKSHGKGSRMG